jgi:hypothetical protein
MAAVFGCITALPLMLWAVCLVQWTIAGDIDFVSGFLGLVVGIGLMFIAFYPPHPAVSPLAFLVSLVTVIFFPFVRERLNRREVRQLNLRQVENALEVTRTRSENAMSRMRIARILMEMGEVHEALPLAESAVSELSPAVFYADHQDVKHWRQRYGPTATGSGAACTKCGTLNAPGTLSCPSCGNETLLERLGGKRSVGTEGRKLIAVWTSLAGALLALAVAFQLPPVAAIAVVVSALVAVGTILYLAFRPEAEPT